MPPLLVLLAAWGVALGINFVPAMMPRTWAVLATFRILQPDLPLLPLTVGGAAMSAVGRVGLALLTRKAGDHLPETDHANAEAVGGFLSRHHTWSLLAVFALCLGPFPSNALFIAAGLARLRLAAVAVTFFLSRAIADTFWVWTAEKASRSLSGDLRASLSSWQAIAIQIVGLALVVLVFRLPWARWLKVRRSRQSQA
jgi:hypothetical protein